MEVDELIYEAILEGARAGVYRAAERLNPKAAKAWRGFAELHSEQASRLLYRAMTRQGVASAPTSPPVDW